MDSAQIRGEGAATEVMLDSALEISGARDLYDRLNRALVAGTPIRLDGGRITRIDCAAIQALAAFQRIARERGIPLCWSSVSPALRQAAETLGLGEVLQEQP